MSARITTPTHKPSKREVDSKSSSATSPRGPPKAVSSLAEKPSSKHFGAVVTVEVGPEKKAFIIHKDLLFFYSDYFRTAFKGSFKEASEGKLSLPEESAKIFYIFNSFIYTGQLSDMDGVTGMDLTAYTLSALWIFGDKYLAPAFQNMAIDRLVERIETRLKPLDKIMTYIYERTMVDAPLRKLAVDWQVYGGNPTTKESLSHWPPEAVIDLAIANAGRQCKHFNAKKLPQDRDRCHYHVHGKGEHCLLD
ncbi:hypothetical protein KCU93_g2178, partial [Aureobasidium melanogenum]